MPPSIKVPDSGMPEESYWNSLFDVDRIIDWLSLPSCRGAVIEIGCGYGTFTLPIARRMPHLAVHALDIEQAMVQRVEQLALTQGVNNIHTHQRDVIANGSGLSDDSAGLVLLFNILHSEHNATLLREAAKLVQPGGRIAIIHWRNDQPTPRGPAMHVRPLAEQIMVAADLLNLGLARAPVLLPPYHWGMQLKPSST